MVPRGALRTCHPCYPGGSRWAVAVVAARLAPAFPQRPRGRHPQFSNEATPGFAARYGLCGCARPSGTRSSGNSALPVTRHASLKLPGRTANSQGRTSTGESHSIHGIRTLLTERNNSDGVPQHSRRTASARMPRQARLDGPGTPHHVTLRGTRADRGRWPGRRERPRAARGLHVGDCESGRESGATISPLSQQRPPLRIPHSALGKDLAH